MNQTLNMIMEFWIGKLPEPGEITLPFHLQNFCSKNNQLLKLIQVDPKKKYWVKQVILPLGPTEGQVAYAVREGSELEKKHGKVIAWFTREADLNNFILRDKDAEIQKLRETVNKLRAEYRVLLDNAQDRPDFHSAKRDVPLQPADASKPADLQLAYSEGYDERAERE